MAICGLVLREPMATLSLPLGCSSPLHCQTLHLQSPSLPAVASSPPQSVLISQSCLWLIPGAQEAVLASDIERSSPAQWDTRARPIPPSVLFLPAGVSPQHNCLTNAKMRAASLPTVQS